MKYYKLKDLCTDIVDCPHSTPDWKDAGIRVVRNFNLKEGNLDFSDGYFVDENTYMERTKRAVPEEGDIIISREAPMGIAAIVPKGLKCCLGQRLVLLKVDRSKCNPFYLLNTLMSDYVQIQFKRADFGSIVSNLCIPDLKEINIPVIVGKQNEVAHLLEIINRKLIINRQVNDNLQQMAKTIYDYWFTQFDFPNEDGKPYRSSGGSMIWNTQMNREIPDGWTVGKLSDIANITMGQSPSGASYNEEGIGVPFYQGSTDFDIFYPHKRMFTTEPSRFANPLDTLLSVRAPVGTMNCAFERCCIGRGLAAITHPEHNEYIHYLLQSNQWFFDKVNNSGTTFGAITKDSLFEMPVVIPPKSLIITFEGIVQPVRQKHYKNEQESRRLKKLRDWLLPMLMNGQATVTD